MSWCREETNKPCHTESIFVNMKIMLTFFYQLSCHRACRWNTSSWNAWSGLSHEVINTAAGELAVQCTRALSATALTYFPRYVPASAPEGLINTTQNHYSDVIMTTMASQITSHTIVYSTVYSGTDQRKHQGSTSLAFVRGIHRWPVNSPHKWPVTRKMFPFDNVIMMHLRRIV